jgi:adenosylcobinamide-phosphate synthase
MKFLALLAALLLEQARPLRRENPVHRGYTGYAVALQQHFDAGHYRHGMMAWLLAVGPLVLAVFLAGFFLERLSPVLGWLWSAVVVYVTVGFRQFSHYFNDILQTIRDGNLSGARDLVARWRAEPSAELSSGEIARVSIELGLAESHRSVFGPIAWFAVLGPAGAILYRAAAVLRTQWAGRAEPQSDEFGRFAERAFYFIDWLPARLTAVSFAAVGNFQDAVDCWRTQSRAWADEAQGVVLASGAGALGVKLGGDLHENGNVRHRPEMGTGDDADADYMRAAVGLIWRALVTWMFLMFIVTLAYSLG